MKRQNAKNRPTIKDIAREADLSPSTVSLVLRDPKTTRVSRATRNKVVEIAKRLNYRPNLLARSLVGQKSSNLGLVITTLLNPFYAELTQSIIDRARQDNYSVIASSVGDGGPEVEQHYTHELLDRGVDGLIICSALRQDPAPPAPLCPGGGDCLGVFLYISPVTLSKVAGACQVVLFPFSAGA